MNFLKYIPDIAAMACVYIYFLRKRWAACRPYAHFLFYLAFCLVFLITLSPFLVDIPHLFRGVYTKYNFNPFVDLVNGYGSPLQECIENIILFVPLTFCYRLATKASFKKAFLLGMLCSALIELTQPLISYIRVCDITDFITNSCGALLGALLYNLYAFCFDRTK